MFRNSPIIRWRNYSDNYRLIGYKCTKCGATYFEKKGVCNCANLDYAKMEFSGKGKIVSFTKIHAGPEVFEHMGNYVVAIIDLEEGARITGQIVDAKYEELSIGQRVEAVFRKFYKSGEKGIIHYGTKFVPVF